MYTVLIFKTDEDVTPEIFVKRIAQACGKHGALRPGEHISTASGSRWRIIDPKYVPTGIPGIDVVEYIEEVL